MSTLKGVLRLFKGVFKRVSRDFQKCFEGVVRGFRRSFKKGDSSSKRVSSKFPGCFSEIFKVIQTCSRVFKEIRMFQGNFMSVSRVFD